MEDDGIDPFDRLPEIEEVNRIIDQRQSGPYLDRFFSDVTVGRPTQAMVRIVAVTALRQALETSAGRKAAGLPRLGRAGDPRFNAHSYGPDSEAVRIASRYRDGKLTRAQAREQLALAIEGEANIKTLNKLLDDLGPWSLVLRFAHP